MEDTDYQGEKPKDWEGEDKRVSETEAHPVQKVDWYDALMFCNWLSRKEGLDPCYEPTGSGRLVPSANGYRLPTEAEWEYACRAGTLTKFYSGDDEVVLQDYAWFDVNSKSKAWPGRGKLPNGFGMFDMHGNVWEWCYDWYKEGSYRVRRGGSWSIYARFCRSGNRFGNYPTYRDFNLGFRVAAGPPASKNQGAEP